MMRRSSVAAFVVAMLAGASGACEPLKPSGGRDPEGVERSQDALDARQPKPEDVGTVGGGSGTATSDATGTAAGGAATGDGATSTGSATANGTATTGEGTAATTGDPIGAATEGGPTGSTTTPDPEPGTPTGEPGNAGDGGTPLGNPGTPGTATGTGTPITPDPTLAAAVEAILRRPEYGPCTSCHASEPPLLTGAPTEPALAAELVACVDQNAEGVCSGDPDDASDNLDEKMPTRYGFDPVTPDDLAVLARWAEALKASPP